MATAQGTSFGAELKRLRRAAGLTQQGLARRAGVSARAISDLERHPDRAPRPDTATLLADALVLDQGDRARLRTIAWPESALPATPMLDDKAEGPLAYGLPSP